VQKWEYKTVVFSRGSKGAFQGGQVEEWLRVDLKQLGILGWELIAVVPVSSFIDEKDNGFTTELYYFFKRPMPEA
jgi:hypothetical protein